jgi:hypothetical protein
MEHLFLRHCYAVSICSSSFTGWLALVGVVGRRMNVELDLVDPLLQCLALFFMSCLVHGVVISESTGCSYVTRGPLHDASSCRGSVSQERCSAMWICTQLGRGATIAWSSTSR